MLGVALLALFACGLFVWAGLSQRAGLSPVVLTSALEASGLVIEAVSAPWIARLRGQTFNVRASVGGRALEARIENEGPGRAPRMTLQLDAHIDPNLSLQVHFGEQTRWVLGDEALAAAIVNARVRAVAGPGDQLLITDGSICLLSRDPAAAGSAVAALTEIAERLDRAPSTETLLSHTAFEDRDPRARAEAAGHLIELRPETAARLANDTAPEVRLAVAKAVGGEPGFELAAEILTSEIFHRDIQQAALRYLTCTHGPDRVGPVLVGALGGADDELQGAIVTALSLLGHLEACAALHAELPTAELRNAARIAEALAHLEGPTAEPALLALLERLPPGGPELPDEEQLAASVADGLGQIGTKAALPSLRALAAVVPADGAVGIAARVALDLVRARSGATELRGALALAGASEVEGRLSDARCPGTRFPPAGDVG